jgi:hypothetical protein
MDGIMGLKGLNFGPILFNPLTPFNPLNPFNYSGLTGPPSARYVWSLCQFTPFQAPNRTQVHEDFYRKEARSQA